MKHLVNNFEKQAVKTALRSFPLSCRKTQVLSCDAGSGTVNDAIKTLLEFNGNIPKSNHLNWFKVNENAYNLDYRF